MQIERIPTEIEEDGEVDRIVPFDSHVGGVKARAGVEADVELVEVDGRNRRERLVWHQSGYLDEIDVDVEGIAGALGWRCRRGGLGKKLGCGHGCKQKKGDFAMRCCRRIRQRSCAMRDGSAKSRGGSIAECGVVS